MSSLANPTNAAPRRSLDSPSDRPGGSSKGYAQPSVFTPANLMREARRQRGLPHADVPEVCRLEPDGDTVRHLAATDRAHLHPGWACYHSQLWITEIAGRQIGIIPCAVGGPYAVLVAEQLVHSGCNLIISVTSAGTITPLGPTPHFILIHRAWRDEGNGSPAKSRSAAVSSSSSVALVSRGK